MVQQMLDGLCGLALRVAHLLLSIHQLSQAWVHNSLHQARFDVQEILQGEPDELCSFLSTLPQRPETFAVILPDHIDSHQEAECVETVCAIAVLAKIPHVIVYSREDGDRTKVVGDRLEKSETVRRAAELVPEPPQIVLNGEDSSSCLNVSLWSRDNGYPALVRIAQELASMVREGGMAVESIDEAMVGARMPGKYPDLVLLYDDLLCLPEFPPWHLQSAEIVQASPTWSKGIGGAVLDALASYAKVNKRWGK